MRIFYIPLIFLVCMSTFLASIISSNNLERKYKEREARAYVAGTVRDIDTALMVYCQSQINNLEAIQYFTASLSVLNKFSITCTPLEDPAAETTPNTF